MGSEKSATNSLKHNVSFEEAATAFGDPLGRFLAIRDIRPKKSGRCC
jgi:uncharacterized DUF497 family protein